MLMIQKKGQSAADSDDLPVPDRDVHVMNTIILVPANMMERA